MKTELIDLRKEMPVSNKNMVLKVFKKNHIKMNNTGVATVVQWVNVLAFLCGIGGSIPSLSWWVKDLALMQLWCELQLWVRSDPWPENSICHRAAKKRKGGRKEEITLCIFYCRRCLYF